MKTTIRKIISKHFIAIILFMPLNGNAKSGSVNGTKIVLTDLQCEGMANPLTIEGKIPKLTWNVKTDQRNWKQTAFQIIVSSSLENLKKNKADLWDSKKVLSDESLNIAYQGIGLSSFKNCYWKVRVCDKTGRLSDWSEPSYWKMAIVNINDWKANWIASDLKLTVEQEALKALPDYNMTLGPEMVKRAGEIRKQKQYDEAPAVYLRKEIQLKPKIKRATAYVCGLGLHELYINGNRVSNEYLNPGNTDYQKRVLYNVYDVTANVKGGMNAVGVILGNGWYNLIVPHLLMYYTADYIAPPKLSLQLRIEYSDGTLATYVTDPTWKYTTNGPIIYNDILSGETYDARKEIPAWDNVGYREERWKVSDKTVAPQGILKAQQLEPVRKLKTFKAVSVTETKTGYRFDFGRELCGWAKLQIKGKDGQKIKIMYPGVGSHTLGRYQTHYYIFKSNELETYEPRFSYNGFRYVDIEGLDYKPTVNDAEAVLVATNLQSCGTFACSNDTLNRIQNILLSTIENYMLHIPNDPTREKAGWTEDVHTGFDVNAYNFDVFKMYKKWQYDFIDATHQNGYVPPVVPSRFDGPWLNGPWWGGVVVYTPEKLLDYYNDKDLVETSYPNMKKYMNYLAGISENHIIKWGLGEWLEPFRKVKGALPTTTPVELTSTIAYYHFAKCMERFATLLTYKQDVLAYSQLANHIYIAYNKTFLNELTGQYGPGSQAGQIMSLKYGLVPMGKKQVVVDRLRYFISEHGGSLSTGFVATPVLLTTLSDLNLGEEAYTMATKTTFPSFYDMIYGKGNSVMKEYWDGGAVQMPSLGGHIGYWFYYSLAGIKPGKNSTAFKKIIIKPDLPKQLTYVSASTKMPYGMISSEWKYKDGKYYFNIGIPANTSADIYLPALDAVNIQEGNKPLTNSKDIKIIGRDEKNSIVEVGSGKYEFQVTVNTR